MTTRPLINNEALCAPTQKASEQTTDSALTLNFPGSLSQDAGQKIPDTNVRFEQEVDEWLRGIDKPMLWGEHYDGEPRSGEIGEIATPALKGNLTEVTLSAHPTPEQIAELERDLLEWDEYRDQEYWRARAKGETL